MPTCARRAPGPASEWESGASGWPLPSIPGSARPASEPRRPLRPVRWAGVLGGGLGLPSQISVPPAEQDGALGAPLSSPSKAVHPFAPQTVLRLSVNLEPDAEPGEGGQTALPVRAGPSANPHRVPGFTSQPPQGSQACSWGQRFSGRNPAWPIFAPCQARAHRGPLWGAMCTRVLSRRAQNTRGDGAPGLDLKCGHPSAEGGG